MAATSEPTRVVPGTVSFELERFERSDGRLELSGRWFGVRGMRFIRPTLTLSIDDGTSSRALADLEHKPWEPADGETWEAAFPCGEDTNVLDAELAVAPGITIPLPAPGDELPDSDPISASEPDSASPKRQARPTQSRRRAPARAGVENELAALRDETQRLRHEPIRLRAELDRSEELRKHVEGELERLKLDSDGAVARRDAAVGRFEDATADREEAIRLRDEAVRAQNEAVSERNEAIGRIEAAIAERDRAVAARAKTLAERNQAMAERDKAMTERDKALTERQRALAERDKAVAERDTAIAERDLARSQRGAIAPRTVKPARVAPRDPVFSAEHDQLIKRAIAIALLFVAGLVLLIVLGAL
jgi:tetratricopeptide (TPR) repeat protein